MANGSCNIVFIIRRIHISEFENMTKCILELLKYTKSKDSILESASRAYAFLKGRIVLGISLFSQIVVFSL